MNSQLIAFETNASMTYNTRKTRYPMQKSTRIQTNGLPCAQQFAQRCVGHPFDHVTIESNATRGTAFYPKKFCQRAVQIWKIVMKRPQDNFSTTMKMQNKMTKFISLVTTAKPKVQFRLVKSVPLKTWCQWWTNCFEMSQKMTKGMRNEPLNKDLCVFTETWAIHQIVF